MILFVSNEGEGMLCFFICSILFCDVEEIDYFIIDVFEIVFRFWSIDSRKKLMECKGRICMEFFISKGKKYFYIELF